MPWVCTCTATLSQSLYSQISLVCMYVEEDHLALDVVEAGGLTNQSNLVHNIDFNVCVILESKAQSSFGLS